VAVFEARCITAAGAILLVGWLAAGCAGGGGAPVENEAPLQDDGAMDAFTAWVENRDLDSVRHHLDPIGPSPAGPDTFTVDWREPAGPTAEGRPLDWEDTVWDGLDFDLGDDWFDWDLDPGLMLTGSLVRATSDSPPGFARLGAHFLFGIDDGSWLSIGLFGGRDMTGPGWGGNGDLGPVEEWGVDFHGSFPLALSSRGVRTRWLMGVRVGTHIASYRLKFGGPYGGLAADIPLGRKVYLTGQGTVGFRMVSEPSDIPLVAGEFEDFAVDFGLELGLIIPLSGTDEPD